MESISKQNDHLRVVAVTGATAAGKDQLAHYLVDKYNVVAVDAGDFARKLAEEADKDEPHLRYDASAKELADFGAEYIMRQLVANIVEKGSQQMDALIITGVRTPAEAAVLKEHFGSDLLLAHIKVGDQASRYDRTQNRDFTTDPDDFEAFVQQDEQLKSDYSLAETAVHADITLWNNDSLEAYYQQIESKVVPHLFPTHQ